MHTVKHIGRCMHTEDTRKVVTNDNKKMITRNLYISNSPKYKIDAQL